MTLTEIKEMTFRDSPKITEANVEEVLAINPALYAKYLALYMEENRNLRQLKSKKNIIYLNLKEYFRGLKDSHDPMVIARGPFNKRILEKEVEMYIDADMDYMQPNEEYEMQKDICNNIREFLDNLKFRPNNAKSFCDWKKFIHGA